MSEHHCEQLDYAVADERLPVTYLSRFREWGIDYVDGLSLLTFHFCPWDGERLPASVRDEWFRRVWDDLGLEPEDPAVPDEMRDERWWRAAGL